MNPYQTLGISDQATAQEIKSAYRHLVKQYHPDRNRSEDAARMIVLINEAYEILSDPQRRAQYDRPWREVFTQQAYQEDPREVYRREYIRKRQEREFEERRRDEEFDNFLISKITPFYKICRAVSYLLVFFASLILVDSYLPVRIYDEPGIDGWYKKSTMRSYMRTKSLVVEVPNQVHFNYPYYSANRPILHIETTGLFKRVKNVSATSNKLILTFEFQSQQELSSTWLWLVFMFSLRAVIYKEYSAGNIFSALLAILIFVLNVGSVF